MRIRCSASAFTILAVRALSLTVTAVPLPDTPKKPVVDEYHSVKVTENYRWLEDSSDPKVKAWVDAQNAVTRAYFDAVPQKDEISARVSQLIRSNSIAYTLQVKRGGLFFALKTDPK